MLFSMNAINALFLLTMFLAAIGLLKLRRGAVKIYTWLYAALLFYVFALGALWGISGPVGNSIAAGSGLGDIGIGPLVFIPVPFVYPIVSVLLVNVSARKLRPRTGTLDSASGTTAKS
jgi:hypothetical protein